MVRSTDTLKNENQLLAKLDGLLCFYKDLPTSLSKLIEEEKEMTAKIKKMARGEEKPWELTLRTRIRTTEDGIRRAGLYLGKILESVSVVRVVRENGLSARKNS